MQALFTVMLIISTQKHAHKSQLADNSNPLNFLRHQGIVISHRSLTKVKLYDTSDSAASNSSSLKISNPLLTP
jgi:hypothetical protein